MIDTHAHIFTKEFNEDLEEVVQRAKDVGVEKILLPNIDVDSYSNMMDVANKYPEFCLPMAGIHPCDIKENYSAFNKIFFGVFYFQLSQVFII